MKIVPVARPDDQRPAPLVIITAVVLIGALAAIAMAPFYRA